jgi:hypothetical protein
MTLGKVREIDLYQNYYCPEGTLKDNHDSYYNDRSRLDSNNILAKNNFNSIEFYIFNDVYKYKFKSSQFC